MTENLGTHHLSLPTVRISGVKLPEAALTIALGMEPDRYESARDGSVYAQINIPDGDDIWGSLVDFAKQNGAVLLSLRNEGLVGNVCVDLAVTFRDGPMALSVTVPSEAAAALGCCCIAIKFSVYRTSDAV